MQKVECYCLFDITDTGINGHTKNVSFPLIDKNGKKIANSAELNQARNQQRNFDTILQLIGLRTQIFNIDPPVLCNNIPHDQLKGKKC